MALAAISASALLTVSKPGVLPKAYAAGAFTWERQDELDRLGGDYTSAAMSASGNHILLSVINGGETLEEEQPSPIFLSANGGDTWENIASNIDEDVWYDWTAVDISNDGQVLVASADGGIDFVEAEGVEGGIFKSEDGGDTWQDITPVLAESDDWDDVAVSGDGNDIVAVENDDDELWITSSGGDSWSTSGDHGMSNLKTVSVSGDGETILVGGENSSPYNSVAISDNSGSTWEDITPSVEDIGYLTHSISDEGNEIALSTWEHLEGGENAALYVSDNYGSSWTDVTPDNEENIPYVSAPISGNGEALSAIGFEGGGAISSNFGSSWSYNNPTQAYPEDDIYGVEADIDGDGSTVVFAGEENVYIGSADSSEGSSSNSASLPNSEDGATVLISTPDGTAITCNAAVKEVALTQQDASYQYPLGLVDFCFDTEQESNDVTLTFVTDLKPEDIVVRKYNSNTELYGNITETSVIQTTYEDQPALQVTYTIVDNGPLDLDPDVGEVADPVGIGVAPAELANTGVSSTIYSFMAITLITTGLLSASLRGTSRAKR